jgi:hypothetical protein
MSQPLLAWIRQHAPYHDPTHKFIKQDIAAKEARIEVLRRRLQKLQDQRDPDLAPDRGD